MLVYVIKRNGHYKIGCTSKDEIGDRYDRELSGDDLIATIETNDPMGCESLMHRLFANCRIEQAEVFALSDNDLSLIRQLASIPDPWPIVESMAARVIAVNKRTCLRCGAEWIPRREVSKQCPVCKSPRWNLPRKG